MMNACKSREEGTGGGSRWAAVLTVFSLSCDNCSVVPQTRVRRRVLTCPGLRPS